jgi:diaminopimelate epimerase
MPASFDPIMTKQANPEAPAIPFYKMQGSGNDFVLLENDRLRVDPARMADWARSICARSFGVGADGLIFLESAPRDPECDYRWHFFNADGSRAEMCGNGSRCAARLAYELGLAEAEHVLGTDAGPVRARVDPASGRVQVQLTTPVDAATGLRLRLGQGEQEVHYVQVGVPHAVVFAEDAASVDLARLGPAVRYHERFSPQGANVNVVQVRGSDLLIRTYERGVEAETYACGTGAAASAVIASRLGRCSGHCRVVTSGGEELEISLEEERVFLRGNAVLVYRGELYPGSVGLDGAAR